MNAEKDQPLRCEVVGNRLMISIGVETLAFADKERTEITVTNPVGFAYDVACEIERQNGIGATMLTDMLDKAMEEAKNNGSAHVQHAEAKA